MLKVFCEDGVERKFYDDKRYDSGVVNYRYICYHCQELVLMTNDSFLVIEESKLSEYLDHHICKNEIGR